MQKEWLFVGKTVVVDCDTVFVVVRNGGVGLAVYVSCCLHGSCCDCSLGDFWFGCFNCDCCCGCIGCVC